MVRCKALYLPPSLRKLDLTVNIYLHIQHQLTVLAKLPRLEDVGLHGPVLMEIPQLPTTVRRYKIGLSLLCTSTALS